MYGMRIKQINLNSARGHYLLYKSTEDWEYIILYLNV